MPPAAKLRTGHRRRTMTQPSKRRAGQIAVALAVLCVAACDGVPGQSTPGVDQATQNSVVPEDDRIKILELQIEELRAELAAEKKTREDMNKELAAAIDEVEAATPAISVPAPAPLPQGSAKSTD